MSNEKNLVQKSLLRFLRENNTDVFITDNSGFSNIEGFTELYSKQDLSSTNTADTIITGTVSDITDFTLTGNGTLFTTEIEIGDTLKINDTLAIVETITDDTSLDFYEVFTETWNVGNDIYIASGKEFVVIDVLDDNFVTDFDLTGWNVTTTYGESVKIESYDLNKSQILLQDNFSEDIVGKTATDGTELSIELDKWIYLKNPYSLSGVGQLHNLEQKDKYVLFIKTKNDNEKEKINDILQNIRNTIYGNKFKFPIYADDGITVLAYARSLKNDFSEYEIYDNNQDLQSFRVDIVVRYFVNYKK